MSPDRIGWPDPNAGLSAHDQSFLRPHASDLGPGLTAGRPRRTQVLHWRGPHERSVVTTFHDFEMDSITGESVALSKYRDQVCLVVNVASK